MKSKLLLFVWLILLLTGNVTSQSSSADTDNNGCVDLGEIVAYVGLWKNGQTSISQVVAAVEVWKQGCSVTPTCSDGIQNQGETGVDCGGPCQACGGGSSFKFISWADTKNARSVLSTLSNQALAHNPVFTIYPGDLEDNGFTTSGMNLWKAAMDGDSSNGMFDITFAARGNHDSKDAPGWQSYFNFGQMASRIGATNYAEMSGAADLTYSFDYGNSHIVAVDVTGRVDGLSNSEASWLDSDLTAAENRGLTHAFIFFHGPIYCIYCGCSTRLDCNNPPQHLIAVLNKHPIVSATFHGHEHIYAHTYLDNTRISSITNPFHQFVTGSAGAGPSSSCKVERVDYCGEYNGFTVVDVNGKTVTVKWYKRGSTSVEHTFSYTIQ
jgi:hypothetical protein